MFQRILALRRIDRGGHGAERRRTRPCALFRDEPPRDDAESQFLHSLSWRFGALALNPLSPSATPKAVTTFDVARDYQNQSAAETAHYVRL
jgi:hypothetical protein